MTTRVSASSSGTYACPKRTMPRRSPSASRKRLAENPADVFDRVMAVDFEIALCLDFQIEMSVPRDLRQHVIEKRNAGLDLVFARAVQIQTHTDIGFIRLPGLRRFSWIHYLVLQCTIERCKKLDRSLPEFRSKRAGSVPASDMR